MAVRKLKPTTPGQRHKIIGTFEEITASVPEKSLVYGKKSSGGRNSEGKMTMRYIGGGHRKVIRIVDFKRNKDGVPAVVKTIEYIHSQLVRQRDEGKAVLLVSLELDEVMNLSDRILVMYEGEIVGEFDPKRVTVEELGLYMAGARRQKREALA